MHDLDELVLIALLALGISSGIAATSAFARHAPEGYEDDTGFHFTDD